MLFMQWWGVRLSDPREIGIPLERLSVTISGLMRIEGPDHDPGAEIPRWEKRPKIFFLIRVTHWKYVIFTYLQSTITRPPHKFPIKLEFACIPWKKQLPIKVWQGNFATQKWARQNLFMREGFLWCNCMDFSYVFKHNNDRVTGGNLASNSGLVRTLWWNSQRCSSSIELVFDFARSSPLGSKLAMDRRETGRC